MDIFEKSYAVAVVASAVFFAAGVITLVVLSLWKPRPKSDLAQLSERMQAGPPIIHKVENVTYLDSAHVSKELRDALKRSGRN